MQIAYDKKIHRLGGKEIIPLNFRVITASNDNLEDLVRQGRFRLDLYHRISVIPLRMPPLRERTTDIPLLIDYFIKKHKPVNSACSFESQAIEWLTRYPWPGNIRQLENLMHRMVVLNPGVIITEKQLMTVLQNPDSANGNGQGLAGQETLKNNVGEFEKVAISSALKRHRWNIRKTAQELKISRTTLYRKIEMFQLSEE